MPTSEEYDPKGRALFDLTHHVLEKGFQAGGAVGSAALVPYAAFRHFRPHAGQDPSVAAVVQRGLRLLAKSALWGVVGAGNKSRSHLSTILPVC